MRTVKRMHRNKAEDVLATLALFHCIPECNTTMCEAGYIDLRDRDVPLEENIIDFVEREVCDFHSERMNTPQTGPSRLLVSRFFQTFSRGPGHLEIPLCALPLATPH